MVMLGYDEPLWAAAVSKRGPEIAAAVMKAVPQAGEIVLESDVDHRRVVVTCTARHHDHYGIAFAITEELASLWDGFADTDVGLRLHVDALQVDVPGCYFAGEPDGRPRRRRWATLSRTQLTRRL